MRVVLSAKTAKSDSSFSEYRVAYKMHGRAISSTYASRSFSVGTAVTWRDGLRPTMPRRVGLRREGLAGKQVQRPLIQSAAIKFRNGLGEFRIGRYRAEQRHRRTELQIVRTAEDFPDCPALDGVDEGRALPKPRSQNAMIEIGQGLIARGDGKFPGHRAVPEPGKLGKNEPHTVTLLLAMAQFRKDTLVDRRLRIQKTLEIEGVSHGCQPRSCLARKFGEPILCVSGIVMPSGVFSSAT